MKLLLILETLLFPFIILLFGILMWCGYPRKPSRFFGFRTQRARQSRQVWQYAQRLCGKMLTILGAVLLISSGLVFFFAADSMLPLATTIVSLVSIVSVSIVPTLVNKKLDQRFD